MKSQSSFRKMFIFTLMFLGVGAVGLAIAQKTEFSLTIDQVMTPDEMHESGVAALNATQKRALNDWLNRYTTQVFRISRQQSGNAETEPVRSSCSPAIESSISGEIEGWSGDTIFKLNNGQIWQQASYDYTYFYAYQPDVTIYQTSAGCLLKVEDETDTVLVKRIK
jgi:hypothetical protein